MDFISAYLTLFPVFAVPFLIFFTKLHDGTVTIGDIVLDTILGWIPFVNVIACLYLLVQTFGRRKWLDVKVF